MDRVFAIYQYLAAVKPKTFGILSLIGALVIIAKIFKVLKAFYKNVIRSKKNLLKRYGKNSWVLVTGSSDGIGKQFALSFAKRGFNVIISARTKSKLQKVAQQIKAINPQSQVKIIVTDFTNCHQQGFFDEFIQQIEQLDISVLVNNVGLQFIKPFEKSQQKMLKDLISVNTIPMTIFARLLIQRFLKRNKKSAIINVASSAMQIPYNGYHVYSASKAFEDLLSRSLSYEYPQLDILSLRPSQVSTPMTSNKEIDLLTITTEQCVEATLRDLGYQRVTNGHIKHKAQSWFIGLFPERVVNFVFSKFILPSFLDQRKRNNQLQKKKE